MGMKKVFVASAGVTLILGSSAPVVSQNSQDWPQFRGPNRNGIATAFAHPAVWPEQLTRKWELEVGEGYATPILVGGRLYVFTREGEREIIRAVDAGIGSVLWQTSGYPAPVTVKSAARAHGAGPKSTPAFADGRLFALGMAGTVTAYDAASGKQLWQRPPDAVQPQWLTGASPLVDRGLVIVHVGGDNRGALTAFDVATGVVKWAWSGDGPSYASPLIAEMGGVRQLVTLTQKNVVGISLADGQLLWQRAFTTQYDMNIVNPVVNGDTVIIGGYQKPTSAFRVARKDGQWTTENVWENPDVWLYMANGVMVGDRLFGLSHKNRGQYFLLDTKSGATVWTSEPRAAENVALVGAGDLVMSLEDDGELVVGRVNSTQFQELKRYKVADSSTWAAPVIAGDRIFVKDTTSLALWTWAATASPSAR
jgi:outer membrane protein assembly factor BamB